MAAHSKHSNIGETMRKSVQRVARAGKGGDTRLAHVNPAEERMLKASGGSGKVNKRTGLKSFEGGNEGGRQLTADLGSIPKGFIRDPSDTSNTGASGTEGVVRIIRAPAPTAPATKAAPKPAAPTVAPAAPPVAPTSTGPTPIAQTLIGAINQSSGNTRSSLLNKTAVKRAKAAGTSEADLVSSVDQSRARSAAKGIVRPTSIDSVSKL